MESTEYEYIKKYAKHCGHCNRNTLLPYEYEFTCISIRYNVIKRKHELCEMQRRKKKIINRLNYAELNFFLHLCRGIYLFLKVRIMIK